MEGTGVEWRGREWSGGEGRGGEGRAGQGRVPDCLGGLSRVGISSRSTRPWNGQPPSKVLQMQNFDHKLCGYGFIGTLSLKLARRDSAILCHVVCVEIQ